MTSVLVLAITIGLLVTIAVSVVNPRAGGLIGGVILALLVLWILGDVLGAPQDRR